MNLNLVSFEIYLYSIKELNFMDFKIDNLY